VSQISVVERSGTEGLARSGRIWIVTLEGWCVRMRKISVGEWQRRLEDSFGEELEVQGLLWWVQMQERDLGAKVTTEMAGHVALMDAWQAFYAQTLHLALSSMPKGEDPVSYWGAILTEHLTAFRDFRAAEVIFRAGYPLAGFRILRDLKNRALFMAAIVGGETTWSALQGHGEGRTTPDDLRKARIREERRVLSLMIREDSGLGETSIEWLRRWEDLFNKEVHGSKLSWVGILDPWISGTPHTLGPQFEALAVSAYTNRASEVAWMWLRVLPYLQPKPEAYGRDWKTKWLILDDSFDFMETGLRESGKKEIVDAYSVLMRTKFDFDPGTAYQDRRPSDGQP